MKRSRWISLGLLAALAGCSLSPVKITPAVFDLGPPQLSASRESGTPLRIAEVSAPPWLDGTGIAYRLAFRDAQRREHYRDSRWAAAPAALLTQRLREQLSLPARGCPGALLTVSLDEFEQVFSAPDAGAAVLRLSASLGPQRAGAAPAERRWALSRPTGTADAAGAAHGLAQAVDSLLPELQIWLNAKLAPCPEPKP